LYRFEEGSGRIRAGSGLGFAFGSAGLFGAALGLLEERGEDAGESYDHGDDEETEAHGAPEGGVARGAGLLRYVGVSQTAGDECEEKQCGGENVEVASHGGADYRILEWAIFDLAALHANG
jgi:hypothetical protein